MQNRVSRIAGVQRRRPTGAGRTGSPAGPRSVQPYPQAPKRPDLIVLATLALILSGYAAMTPEELLRLLITGV